MAKIKEYYQVGNREEMTVESLLVLMEDMYKDLALAINSNTSSGDGNIVAFVTVSEAGTVLAGSGLTSVRNSTGYYTLTFTAPRPNIYYTVITTPQVQDATSVWSTTIGTKTINSFVVKIKALRDSFENPRTFSVIVLQ